MGGRREARGKETGESGAGEKSSRFGAGVAGAHKAGATHQPGDGGRIPWGPGPSGARRLPHPRRGGAATEGGAGRAGAAASLPPVPAPGGAAGPAARDCTIGLGRERRGKEGGSAGGRRERRRQRPPAPPDCGSTESSAQTPRPLGEESRRAHNPGTELTHRPGPWNPRQVLELTGRARWERPGTKRGGFGQESLRECPSTCSCSGINCLDWAH